MRRVLRGLAAVAGALAVGGLGGTAHAQRPAPYGYGPGYGNGYGPGYSAGYGGGGVGYVAVTPSVYPYAVGGAAGYGGAGVYGGHHAGCGHRPGHHGPCHAGYPGGVGLPGYNPNLPWSPAQQQGYREGRLFWETGLLPNHPLSPAERQGFVAGERRAASGGWQPW